MKIFADEFSSPEIKGYIESTGVGSPCGDKKRYSINLEEIAGCFLDFTQLFCKAKDGQTIVEEAVRNWSVFASGEIAYKVLSEILGKYSVGYSLSDAVALRPEVDSGRKTWENLKNQVREEKRFFAEFEATELSEWLGAEDWLRNGSDFYRARIVPQGEKSIGLNCMGCPPAEKATGGRANPDGIAYLYLSESEETTVYEVRALYLDRISIARFRLLEAVRVVDFVAQNDIFDAYFSDTGLFAKVVKKKIALREMGRDLSRPLRRYDNPVIEYAPTQALCEFCKLQGADGVRFKSSLHPDGINVVFFDERKVRCEDVKTVEVDKLELSVREVSL